MQVTMVSLSPISLYTKVNDSNAHKVYKRLYPYNQSNSYISLTKCTQMK